MRLGLQSFYEHARTSVCMRLCMRPWISLVATALLASCASTPSFDGRVEVLTTSRSQPLSGADCVVETGAGVWNVSTPGVATVGQPQGDLRVVCSKQGYRSSEVLFRHGATGRGLGAPTVGLGVGGGFGGNSSVGVSLGLGFPVSGSGAAYPAQVIVDMTPL